MQLSPGRQCADAIKKVICASQFVNRVRLVVTDEFSFKTAPPAPAQEEPLGYRAAPRSPDEAGVADPERGGTNMARYVELIGWLCVGLMFTAALAIIIGRF